MTDDLPSAKRLLWQCRRGMLELDYVLANYVNTAYETAALEEKTCFILLLKEPDQLLYDWLMGKKSPANEGYSKLIGKMKTI